MADVDLGRTLAQVTSLELEIERVKRDLLRSLPREPEDVDVPSLFGSVEGGDVTEAMIAEAKGSLFRTSGENA